jgi:hypothetical protein
MRPRHINLPLEVVPEHENFSVWVSAVFLNCDFIIKLVIFLSIKLYTLIDCIIHQINF